MNVSIACLFDGLNVAEMGTIRIEPSRACGFSEDELPEVACADHRIQWRSFLDAFADEHVFGEDGVRSRIVAAYDLRVFVKWVQPEEWSWLVGRSVKRLVEMGDDFAGNLVWESPPGVVCREECDAVGDLCVSVLVDP